MPAPLNIGHIIQPAILCRDIDEAMDRLQGMFGIYPSERVDITNTGVNNAVYALGGFTFLELIEPYDFSAAAGRLLERFGEGFHMVAALVADATPDSVDYALEEASVRVIRRNKMGNILGAWHLHPKDTLGVLIALALRSNQDNSEWAGAAWREYVRTNSRILSRLLGVSLACSSMSDGVRAYEALGFEFGEATNDEGDVVREAWTAGGTVLQLRVPESNTSPAANQLSKRGSGLCHLLLEAPDLEVVGKRMAAHGARPRETEAAGEARLWSDAHTTWGIPFEIRPARSS